MSLGIFSCNQKAPATSEVAEKSEKEETEAQETKGEPSNSETI